MLKKYKMKKILKLTVNTGQVMFLGEIYYYWPFNSSEKVDKIIGKTSVFKAKKWKYVGFNRYFDL